MLRLRGIQGPYLILQAKSFQARAAELESIRVSAEQARASDHIIDKPLIVLTAGKSDASLRSALGETDYRRFQKTWVDNLQMRLASLSTRGKRIIVPDAGHDIPNERPGAIVDAVRELCQAGSHD
jgi:pimeloyl-ACP methyl ester carboxylesterase